MKRAGCHDCRYAGEQFKTWNASPCSKCHYTPSRPDLMADIPPDALRNIPAPEPQEHDPVYSDAAALLKSAIRTLMATTGNSPTGLACALARLGGLTYTEIAATYGTSKNTVKYHLNKLAADHPRLGKLLAASHYQRPSQPHDDIRSSIRVDVLKAQEMIITTRRKKACRKASRQRR
jgi:hypothetical protein